MFATKLPIQRLSFTRLHLFSPIRSFVRAEDQAQSRLTSEIIEEKTLSFDQIPGPRGRFATAVEFYRQSDGYTKFYKIPQKLFKDYGPIFKQYVTDKSPVVHVMEPADFEAVFRAEGKYPSRPPLDCLIEHWKRRGQLQSMDMLNLNGEEWKRIRQALAPKIKRPKVLEENIDNFNSVAEDAIERLAKIKGNSGRDGDVPDLEGELKNWATESVGTLVLDTRIGLYNDPPSEEAVKLIQGVDDALKYMQILIFGFLEKNLLPYMDTPSFKKLGKALASNDAIFRMFVNKKIKELEEMAKRDDLQGNQTVPYLTYLLVEKELTPEEVGSNVGALLAAGVDTTSYATLWLLYHLARSPTVQGKLHQELYTVLGKDRNVTAGSLAKLSYLKACVKESARMTPVVAANRRLLEKDVVLSGVLVPAKTIIQLDFYATGRSEKHFKNASEYIPERWLRENKKEIHPFSFLPFGFGPRMCVGNRVAELEMYLMVAKIIQRFRLEYHHEPLEMTQKFLVMPEKPVRIKFVERY